MAVIFDKLKFPLVQAPILGVSTPAMTAAATYAGCLGSLALGDYDAEQCAALIEKVKRYTKLPFAVNIFTHKVPAVDDELAQKFTAVRNYMTALARENNIEARLPFMEEIVPTDYREQLETVMALGCKILSFTFGCLTTEETERLHKNGITVIGTCTSVKEALVLEESGVDILCAQGAEAGGHRGSFLTEGTDVLPGTELLQAVKGCTKLPVIYAGGMYKAADVRAKLAAGATACQIGTALLCSAESALQPCEKAALQAMSTAKDITLTKAFSGRYAQGLANTFISEVERAGAILPYPYQNKLTAPLRKAARSRQATEFLSLWHSSVYGELKTAGTAEILKDITAGL